MVLATCSWEEVGKVVLVGDDAWRTTNSVLVTSTNSELWVHQLDLA